MVDCPGFSMTVSLSTWLWSMSHCVKWGMFTITETIGTNTWNTRVLRNRTLDRATMGCMTTRYRSIAIKTTHHVLLNRNTFIRPGLYREYSNSATSKLRSEWAWFRLFRNTEGNPTRQNARSDAARKMKPMAVHLSILSIPRCNFRWQRMVMFKMFPIIPKPKIAGMTMVYEMCRILLNSSWDLIFSWSIESSNMESFMLPLELFIINGVTVVFMSSKNAAIFISQIYCLTDL